VCLFLEKESDSAPAGLEIYIDEATVVARLRLWEEERSVGRQFVWTLA
jgi:hypothetical protein